MYTRDLCEVSKLPNGTRDVNLPQIDVFYLESALTHGEYPLLLLLLQAESWSRIKILRESRELSPRRPWGETQTGTATSTVKLPVFPGLLERVGSLTSCRSTYRYALCSPCTHDTGCCKVQLPADTDRKPRTGLQGT